MDNLILERKSQVDESPIPGTRMMITPPVGEDDYWAYRVRLSDKQAIVGFPKFGTVGIGFKEEEDWNTNLPYRCPTEQIWNHIKHNAGDPAITPEIGMAAIRMIQDAVAEDKGEAPWKPTL